MLEYIEIGVFVTAVLSLFVVRDEMKAAIKEEPLETAVVVSGMIVAFPIVLIVAARELHQEWKLR